MKKTNALLRWTMWDGENLRFIKKQEAGWLLSNLKLKTHSSKFPLLGDILFKKYKNEWNSQLIFIGWWKIHTWNAFKTDWIYI